jgi:hypothetical protein
MEVRRVFEKDRWEGIKAFFDAIRTPFVVFIVVILFVFPGLLSYFISRAGFKVDQVEFAGVKLAAKTTGDDLEATADKLKQVTAALAERDKFLGEIADQLTNPTAKEKLAAFIQSGQQVAVEAHKTASIATQQAAEVQTTLRELSPSTPGATSRPSRASNVPGSFLFVFGADHDEGAALDEIRNAQPAVTGNETSLALFRKGNFYRSVAVFPTESSRTQTVPGIEHRLNRTGQAVFLPSWCPGASRVRDAISQDGKTTAPVYQC